MRNTMLRRSLVSKLSFTALLALVGTGLSTAAFAHVGDHSSGLVGGLAHPFTGLDHILAMVAVGLWASQLERPVCWLLPLTFPTVMAFGALLGASGLVLPLVEPAIAASVLVLGALIALALRPSLAVSALLIALFALFHGYSHGVEVPAQGSVLAYDAGFIAATLALHAIGFAIGTLADHAPVRNLARAAGAAIAIIGVLLLAAA
jgi:urease accessory protein